MGKDDIQIIIEYFNDKFATVLENIDTIITTKVRAIVKEEVSQELEPVKTDVKTIKTAVTDTNKDILALQNDLAELQVT